MKISLTILGEPASKANSRQLVTLPRWSPKKRAKVPMAASIKSEKARDYEAAALVQIPPSARVMMTGPVRVTMRIFYATALPDLDESVVLDVLQARYAPNDKDGPQVHYSKRPLLRAGVYVNDRQVREKHIYWGIDKANPRAEIEVEEIVAGLFDELAPPLVTERVKRSPHREKLEHFIATGEPPF